MRSRRLRSAVGRRVLTAALAVSVVAGVPAVAQASPQSAALSAADSTQPIYLNTHYTFAERAADLVSRMTEAEKVAQLQTNNAPAIPGSGSSSTRTGARASTASTGSVRTPRPAVRASWTSRRPASR